MPVQFVSSPYGWVLGPGDGMLVDDYGSPTRVTSWLNAEPITISANDKQAAYGQWIAQLLQVQLGIGLVELYYAPDEEEWPITLREDVIAAFDSYFAARSQ